MNVALLVGTGQPQLHPLHILTGKNPAMNPRRRAYLNTPHGKPVKLTAGPGAGARKPADH